jgi:hypothetical protein
MLRCRASWTAGYLEIRYDATRRVVLVSTYTPTTGWRSWGTSPTVTYVAGDQLGARARASGAVEVYRNGAVFYTTSVAGWTYAASGGRIGVSLENATSSRLDNFGGGTYSTGPNRAPTAVAGGTPASGNAPLTVTFAATGSSDPDGDPLGYAWAFGDGQSGSGASVPHVYGAAGTYAALLTVTDGRGGQDTASVEIVVSPAPPVTFTLTGVLDNFNRSNGSLGGLWLATSGVTVNSNQLASSGGSSSPVWNGAVFGADQEAYVTLSLITTSSPEHDLMLKVQGTSATAGYLEIRYDAVQRVMLVSTFTPGTGWRLWATSPTVTFVAGDQLGARTRASGAVEIYLNGGLFYSTSIAGWTYAASGGRIGLSLENANSSRLDNFGGGSVPASLTGGPVAATSLAPLAVVSESVSLPRVPTVSSGYPNPTRAAVALELGLPHAARVAFSVHDLDGREVWRQAEREYGAGNWTLRWSGTRAGRPMPPGLYFARVVLDGVAVVRRISLLR